MQKKQIILVVASLLAVVLSVTLAYFTSKLISTGNNKTSVASSKLQIIFTDSDGSISGSNIEPGWSSTKKFTVTNKSNEAFTYNIVIQNLINTFVTEGYLKYKITGVNGGYSTDGYINVPKSDVATDTILAENISIELGVTQTYTIEFIYQNDENVDQSGDMGKKLSGVLFITEGTAPTLVEKILEDNPTRSARTDFTTPFTTNTVNTLYKAKEDNIDVYYFAGIDATEGHCEYNGNIIQNISAKKLTESQCLSNLSLCWHEDSNELTYGDDEYYGWDTACEDRGGTLITSNGSWISGIEKPINNWVKFGKNSSNQDLYWRIIRTNSDGSIRLLYHGTSTTAINAYIGTSAFNNISNYSMNVGYMYGDIGGTLANARTNTNNSKIKTAIDNWYASNMPSYTKYLSTTAVYCNDREVGSGSYSATGSSFEYAAYTRLNTNKTPTYDCTNDNDKFTVDASSGNGKLTYPIALMTADEIAYAGGVYGEYAPMWYYTNSSLESSTGTTYWWSLSPFNWSGYDAGVFLVGNSSSPDILSYYNVSYAYGVRPVTSLKSCVKYSSGDGSASSPYTIEETESGC